MVIFRGKSDILSAARDNWEYFRRERRDDERLGKLLEDWAELPERVKDAML